MKLMPLLFVLTACSHTVEEGFSVEVKVQLKSERALDVAGVNHTFDAVALTVSSARLVACASSAWWHRISLISTAYAHSESDHLTLGEPHIFQANASASFGSFSPPPDKYCSVSMTLAPADDDAVGVSAELVGSTVSFAVDAQPAVRIAGTQRFSLPLGPLDLSRSQAARSQVLTVVFDTRTWLSAIDLSKRDDDALLQAIAKSATLQ